MPASTDPLRRYSQIKRKPAPTHLFPTASPIITVPDKAAGGDSKPLPDLGQLPPLPSFSAHTEEFWRSLDEINLEEETDTILQSPSSSLPIPTPRPRASSVPSKRFSNVNRVPAPRIDFASASRTAGSLTSASLQTLHARPVSDGAVSRAIDLPEPVEPPSPALIHHVIPRPPGMTRPKRTSRFSFPRRDKSKNLASSGSTRRQQTGISAASANASMVSLSAFPMPPSETPPVPPLPTNQSLSFILQVDPPADAQSPRIPSTSSEPNLVPTSTDVVAGMTSRDAKGKEPVRAAPQTDGPNRQYFFFDDKTKPEFDEHRLPTLLDLEQVAALAVISETGVRVPFGALFRDQKTIVCFIRHFWCPLCQDYMFSISRNVSPEVLAAHGVDLVIVSNGSHEMIRAYRKIFKTPFAVYTDPTHRVYNALGMTLQTLEKGHKGSYVKHGTLSGIGMVVKNAAKVGMPVWRNGGEISQLGGEFVLGPGLRCDWAHRMRYTRDHVSILDVIAEAGIDMVTPLRRVQSSTGTSFDGIPVADADQWMRSRRSMLKKIRASKLLRRGGSQYQVDTASTSTSSETRKSNRDSMGSSLCSWNVATEEAINIEMEARDMEIIEEVEEEERMEHDDSSTTHESKHTDFSDVGSEVDSVATEPESSEGRMVVAVSFEEVKDKYEEAEDEDEDDDETVSSRSSWSSFGSGYDEVASSHSELFMVEDKVVWLTNAISMSSMGL
ncbi:Peptidase A1 domain-containing protein [Mycena kentingensis (nom. inval.)]|nr:Peptidase A1 domain-containing protein [Mycena kentingensis (nom. inval.)]